MSPSVEDLLSVVPHALAVTSGVDHVVEWISPLGARLLGESLSVGRPLGEAGVPGTEELVAAAAWAYGLRRKSGVTVGRSAAETSDRLSCGRVTVSCEPLPSEGGATSGVLLREVPEGDELAPGDAGGAGRSRARGFQRLTEQLSSAATPQEIGQLAATTAATLLEADDCGVYTRAPDSDVLESLYTTGTSGDAVSPFRRVPIRPGRPLSDAVLTASPVWLEDGDQWRSRYPEMASAGVSGGHQACVCLPLRVDDRELGAVVFRFRRPRVFGSGERGFLVAVASLCAQALDRARLYAAESDARAAAERERDRMTFLAQASQLMEAPLSVEERLQRLADFAVTGIADWSAVHLVRADRVEQIAVAHLDPEKVAFVEELERRYPPDPEAEGGALQVARSGHPVVMTDVADELLVASAADATHLELMRALGLRSAIVVPLLVRGRSLGALTLVHAESGRQFVEDDLTFAGQLAATAAIALDNAALYEKQRTVAHTLQTALLPSELPDIPGMRCAGRYRPPTPELTDVWVGGDLYDVCQDDERGRWALTVADVCGKGPEAAALTALIRHTVHAEVNHGHRPTEVLRWVNAAMLRDNAGSRARFATVVHAHLTVDETGASVRLVNGGHLPALVLRSGRVESVAVAGTLLGVYRYPKLSEVQMHIGPGDTLVLYTDGVTEARRGHEWYGSERLEALLASLDGGSADDIADGILADICRFQRGELHDDVAVLVAQATA
ncbi:SpoIIE family protein phosphatase [Actinomycetospora sp.]|uniref:SpoIIE family protein phosphatase n=1 Tax=Actinomycetospora sp. TaxID=1872135 RepID=UPI002F4240FA